MVTTKRILLASLAALAMMAASPVTAPAQEYLVAELHPTDAEPLASGWAEWQRWDVEHRPPLRPFLIVEVQDVYSTESVQVVIHRPESAYCQLVGVIHLTDGSGRLWRPNVGVRRDDEILIADETTGTLLLWGVFE